MRPAAELPAMVLAVESQFSGHQHGQLNAAMLDSLAEAFPGARLVLAAAPGHREALEALAASWDRWENRPFTPPAGGSIRGGFEFFRSLRPERGGLAVNLNASVLQMTAAAAGAQRGRWWHVVHLACDDVQPRLPRPIRSFAFPRILRLSRIAYYDVSLTPSHWNERLLGIGHPFHFRPEPWIDEARIRLGLFGSPSNYIDRLERLIGLLGPLAAQADWAAIGFVRDPAVRSRMAGLNIAASDEPLAPAAYRRSAGSCHAGLWLNDPAVYERRASGSLVDALAAGRPVIGLDCGFNRTTLARCGGAGRLAADVEGVAEILRQEVLREGGAETLKAWAGRIGEGRDSLSPEGCGRRLREAWESGF